MQCEEKGIHMSFLYQSGCNPLLLQLISLLTVQPKNTVSFVYHYVCQSVVLHSTVTVTITVFLYS